MKQIIFLFFLLSGFSCLAQTITFYEGSNCSGKALISYDQTTMKYSIHETWEINQEENPAELHLSGISSEVANFHHQRPKDNFTRNIKSVKLSNTQPGYSIFLYDDPDIGDDDDDWTEVNLTAQVSNDVCINSVDAAQTDSRFSMQVHKHNGPAISLIKVEKK